MALVPFMTAEKVLKFWNRTKCDEGQVQIWNKILCCCYQVEPFVKLLQPQTTTKVSHRNKDDSSSDVLSSVVTAEYNQILGGTDHFDQRRWRSIKWWHCLFIFSFTLLQQIIL